MIIIIICGTEDFVISGGRDLFSFVVIGVLIVIGGEISDVITAAINTSIGHGQLKVRLVGRGWKLELVWDDEVTAAIGASGIANTTCGVKCCEINWCEVNGGPIGL